MCLGLKLMQLSKNMLLKQECIKGPFLAVTPLRENRRVCCSFSFMNSRSHRGSAVSLGGAIHFHTVIRRLLSGLCFLVSLPVGKLHK